jgi:hypothetical protein
MTAFAVRLAFAMIAAAALGACTPSTPPTAAPSAAPAEDGGSAY